MKGRPTSGAKWWQAGREAQWKGELQVTITEQKSFEEIVEKLAGARRVFIVGCGECATLCQTGGEYEVEEMKRKLEEAGFEVVGTAVPEATCEVLVTKRELRKQKEAFASADAVLVLACGVGVQALAEIADKPAVPGLNTLFLGGTLRQGQHYEWCSCCGECVLADYAGICPVTRCPKGQMNGPCGGADEGKCEVDPEQDCVWALILERAEKLGILDRVMAAAAAAPRDYSKQRRPRKRVFEPRRAGI